MKEAGVNISVILPVITKPEQFASMNAYARKITPDTFDKNTYGQILSFGAVHPYSLDYKAQLREVKEMGLKGIKIHPDYLGIMIDDPKMMRLIDEASSLGLIMSVHAGIDVGLPDKVHCPPERSRKVIDAVRPEKFILAHTGGWKQWDQAEALLVGENVYLDVSVSGDFMPEEQMKRIIENHGADKILFATDSPWGGQKQGIEYVKSLKLDKESEEKILWKNAADLLGIW